MSRYLKIALFISAATLAACQTKSKFDKNITRGELYQHVDFLASDSLMGRFPGTPFDRVSAKYIRDHFERAGLKMLGEYGYQFFDVILRQSPGRNVLKYNGLNFEYGLDFATFPFSANDSIDAKVVFVGYGFKINNDKLSWDDYLAVNVNRKWVLILRGDPEPDNPNSVFAGQASDRNKVMLAKDNGAAGVILVSGNLFDPKDQLVTMDERGYNVGIPVIQVTRNVADKLLAGVGKVELLEKKLNADRAPLSRELAQKVYIKTEVNNDARTSQNVVALIKGSDPVLAREYIVVGAHYDHLGTGGKHSNSRTPDTIAVHNGADDNASGVSAMIEIAQKLSANRQNLKRSVVLVAFGAEEMGLIGSQKFVESGIIPVDSIEAMVNLDMVGRMADNTLQIGGVKSSVQSVDLLKSLNPDSTLKLAMSPEGYGPSDHASFYTRNIPVFFITTGPHIDYHTPFDDKEKINFEGMVAISNYVYSLCHLLATQGQSLTFQEAGPKSQSIRGRGFKVRLGIIPDVSGMSNNGLKALGVNDNSPAQNAGMQTGDVITAINGKSVRNIQDYMYRLSELKAGMTVSVEVRRGDKTIILLVQL
jgi:hypothetical protein